MVVGTTTLDSTVDTSFGQANLLNSQFHTATYSTALGQTPCSMEGYYRYKVTVGCQDPLPDEWVHAMGTDAPGEHVSCPLTTADLATEYIVVLNMTHLNFCPLQGGLLDTAVTFTGGIEISDNDVDEGTSSPTRCLYTFFFDILLLLFSSGMCSGLEGLCVTSLCWSCCYYCRHRLLFINPYATPPSAWNQDWHSADALPGQ